MLSMSLLSSAPANANVSDVSDINNNSEISQIKTIDYVSINSDKNTTDIYEVVTKDLKSYDSNAMKFTSNNNETNMVLTNSKITAPPQTKTETVPEKPELIIPPDSGEKLTARKGVNYGPSGKETWYNLDMDGVIYLMNHLGYSSEDYPYWVREDGCKMFGDYIMVAADLDYRPKGTILECSLGPAIVVDTGDLEPHQLDIAVDWV